MNLREKSKISTKTSSKGFSLKPVSTEKAVMKIEAENIMTFEVDKRRTKPEIKKEIEEVFGVKVDKLRTQIRNNKKLVSAKLNPKNLAIDIATKLGMM